MSLADGKLVALDEATGDTLWTFDTGAPLVSSANAGGGGEDGGGPLGPGGVGEMVAAGRENIFPGTDGSLYAYRLGEEEGEPPRIEVCRSRGARGRRGRTQAHSRAGVAGWLLGCPGCLPASPPPTG